MLEYLSIKQVSEKWGISVKWVQVLCAEERIKGAAKVGFYWIILEDVEKPNDNRVRSGINYEDEQICI